MKGKENTDSMTQEVVDLVNQGLTRQQIVTKLANHKTKRCIRLFQGS